MCWRARGVTCSSFRRPWPGAVILAAIFLMAGGAPLDAQSAQQHTPRTTAFVRNWTRAEAWSFFEPRLGGGDPTYRDVANRLQIGLRRVAERYEFLAAVQYVQFGWLPRDASGPGALGTGAAYFSHAGRTDSRQAYVRYLSVRVKELVPGLSVQLGRMGYTDGAEAPAAHAKIDSVKQQRATSRMIGEFEWSIYQRGFDGIQLDWDRFPWHVCVSALHPTQGGFEDRAGLRIDDIRLLTATLNAAPRGLIPNTDVQLFFYRYDDTRAVGERPDNTGRTTMGADIRINSFGVSMIGAVPLPSGELDGLVWFAGQTGTWYEQIHDAFALAAEIGHQWGNARWRPWLRGGLLKASGDPDPADTVHETFFQMLPTSRKFSQSATYSFMNLTDLFTQVLLSPTAKLSARLDLHRVTLGEPADRWYAGSGATQRAGTIFGFSGRPSHGATGLGTVVEGSASYGVTPHWSVNGYVGFIDGGEVVERTFAGDRLTFGYIENVVSF